MRLLGRLISTATHSRSACLLALLAATACSLPEVNVQRGEKYRDTANTVFLSKPGDTTSSGTVHYGDKNYIASVHIQFTESPSVGSINFDIHREKSERVSFNLLETETTSTFLHFGTTDGGPVGGVRFIWRF